jgi:nucleoside-diphosphate-sugar epimerase
LIFISGITGFLGSTIAKILIDKGEKVVGLKRGSSKLTFLKNYSEKIIWKEGDINDIPSLEDAMKGCDFAIHCAAIISLRSRDALKMYKVNVEGTANMINVALYHQVKKFIHISSVAALPAIEDHLINEDATWYSKPYPSTYGLSKFLSEREVQRGMAEGLSCVILNPSSIIGNCDWNTGPGLFFTNMDSGLPFYTEGIGGFVDVFDVANIAIKCLYEDKTNNSRFIVSAENISYKLFFEMIAVEMNKKPPTIKLNPLVSYLAIFMDAIKHWITKAERMVTFESLKMAKINPQYDNSKVKKVLNIEFIPMKETVKNACASYFEQKNTRTN